MFCVAFCWILKIIAPGSGFCTFFVPGGGAFALSKNSPGFALGGGGWSGLELTDTL